MLKEVRVKILVILFSILLVFVISFPNVTAIENFTTLQSPSNPQIENNIGFTGQRYFESAGLYLFPGRAYNPELGRFLQRDPSGYSDGVNLYEYVEGNALGATDPTGLYGVGSEMAVDYSPVWEENSRRAPSERTRGKQAALGNILMSPLTFLWTIMNNEARRAWYNEQVDYLADTMYYYHEAGGHDWTGSTLIALGESIVGLKLDSQAGYDLYNNKLSEYELGYRGMMGNAQIVGTAMAPVGGYRLIGKMGVKKYAGKSYPINILGKALDEVNLFRGKNGIVYKSYEGWRGSQPGSFFDLKSHLKDGRFWFYGAPAGDTFIWTIDKKGNFNVGIRVEGTGKRTSNHAVLAAGEDVFGAGEVTFRNGLPVEINAWSGHYVDERGSISFNKNSIEAFRHFSNEYGLNIDPNARFVIDPPYK